LTGVRWMYGQAGGADNVRLQTSLDAETWTALVTTGNRAPQTWEGSYADGIARYVRLVFDNPYGVATLGHLAEFQVWGTGAGGDQAASRAGSAPDAVLWAPPKAIFRRRRRSVAGGYESRVTVAWPGYTDGSVMRRRVSAIRRARPYWRREQGIHV
jgi:hypothetical protein